MKDQVDALVARGVKAASLDSTLGMDRATWVKQEVASGAMKILYVAPERYVVYISRGHTQLRRSPGSITRSESHWVIDSLRMLNNQCIVIHRVDEDSENLVTRRG